MSVPIVPSPSPADNHPAPEHPLNIPPRAHARPTATPLDAYHAPATPATAWHPHPTATLTEVHHYPATRWQPDEPPAVWQRLTAQQCIDVAERLYRTSYVLERVNIGGRGWRDVLHPAAEGSRAPRFLVETDASHPRGGTCYIARWHLPGQRAETFGTLDRVNHLAFLAAARALARPAATDARGRRYMAHAPAPDLERLASPEVEIVAFCTLA